MTWFALNMSEPTYLSASDAANALDVTKNTLYAYVSRGLIRSEPVGDGRRAHRYPLEDIQRLRKRRAQRASSPAPATGEVPTLSSRLTRADDQGLYYRGHDATNLALIDEPEDLAALLWETETAPDARDDLPPDVTVLAPLLTTLSPVHRMQALLPVAEADDPRAFDLSGRGAARTGWRVLRVLTHAIVAPTLLDGDPLSENGRSSETVSAEETGQPGVMDTLTTTWRLRPPLKRRLVRAAVNLSVDHGLNVSAYAARCAASAGATPYGAVLAGLTALLGRRHAGGTERVAALLREAEAPDRLAATMAQRLRRGDSVPGFRHPNYPDGDPRAAVLFDFLDAHFPDTEGTAYAVAARNAGPDLLDAGPTLDFALVAVARTLSLPAHAPLTILALGRSIGWTAHAIEQYTSDVSIQPRARYIGPDPR